MLFSEEQEIALGEQNYLYMQQAEGGEYITDPEVQKYVSEVGQRLAKGSDRPYLPYEFVVLNNSTPNAWSLPGGKIAINRGLLQELQSEAELAAVLAHEIVHSAARHTAQRVQRGALLASGLTGLSHVVKGNKYEDVLLYGAGLGASLIFFKYSRDDEREADLYGIKYMVIAGYDPQAAVELQRTFVRLSQQKGDWNQGLLASHPASQERVENNQIAAARYAKGGKIGAEEYEKKMEKLKSDKPAYDALDEGYAVLIKSNNAGKALQLADKGVKIEPLEAHLLNLKGKALLKLGEPRLALEAFTQAVKLNPHYFDFYLQKGLVEKYLGDTPSAERDLKQSMKLLPTTEAQNALQDLSP